MDTDRYTAVQSAFAAAPSRRAALSALGGLSLAGLLDRAETTAKKKKKKKKTCPTCPTCPTSPTCPPPLPLTGPGQCGWFVPGPGSTMGNRRRFAQTFLPPDGGQLTAAVVYLTISPANYFLELQIRTVDGTGVPTNTILASRTVGNIPQTTAADPPQFVLATFQPPAAITLGQQYALSVTGPDTLYRIVANTTGNPCPDGKLFGDTNATGTFVVLGTGEADLVYQLDFA